MFMDKEQLGKNIFAILKKEKNNIKLFQIKHKTKIKIWFLLENNNIHYTKIRSKKYFMHYIAWLKFHPDVKVSHIGNIELDKEQTEDLKNHLSPNLLLYYALRNNKTKIVYEIIKKENIDYDDIILSCCDCSYQNINILLKSRKHLYEKVLLRAIFNKNKQLVENICKKVNDLYYYMELTSNIGFLEIFEILKKQFIKKTNLNKN